MAGARRAPRPCHDARRLGAADASTFRIPVARDARGRLVAPAHAKRGEQYVCPGCDGRVDLHAGEKKQRHFHHRAGTCTSESVLHLSAKRLVAQAVEDWLDGGPAVTFLRSCAHPGCEARRRQEIPKKVAGVALEHQIFSGHVVDVALLAAGPQGFLALPVAAIEVRFTHAVDAHKARELGVPWIEVDAEQVCAAEGRELVPVRDRFVPWLCAEHEETRGKGARAEREDREKRAALAKRMGLRLADYPGYRVERVGRCPRGHESLVFAWDGREPPWPRPPNVVARQADFDWSYGAATKRVSKVLPWRRTYASVCATCGEPLET